MIKQCVSAVVVILITTLLSFSQNTFVPDNNFENYLETHNASGNVVAIGAPNSMGNGIASDNFVITTRINTVTNLNVSSQNISDLTGIEDFSDLYELACGTNNLTDLDVSANTALEILAADNLPFLTRLNIANGNNSAMIVLAINNNPNLGCITVDNQTIANNWNSGTSLPSVFFSQDPTSSFSADCGGTFVPDNNFENYLETHDALGNFVSIGSANSMGNGIANDNFVITTRINSVTSLFIANLNIEDLTGIEDFISLTSLSCGSNQLTSLDVSAITGLIILSCDNNNLISLDVSANTSLVNLNCGSNQLTSLDVSAITGLITLDCDNNNLTSLDVSANTSLVNLNVCCNVPSLTRLNLANGNNSNMDTILLLLNPNLTCVTVDNQSIADNWGGSYPNIFIIDPQTAFSTNCDTFVPDDNFENYLETHDASGAVVPLGDPTSMGNGTANDNYVTTTNINTVTILNVTNQNIVDVSGIEGFTALAQFECTQNQITSLDLSANTSLTVLICGFNQLISLDVSENTALAFLTCNNNNLTYLNVANGNNLNFFLPFGFNTENNPNLTCIEVDDAAYATGTWGNIDPGSSFSEDCGITLVPDDNFENYLETHDASGAVVPLGDPTSMGNGIANDNYVVTASINTVTTLDINTQNIADLRGIEDFTGLTTLNCWSNQLTSLDMSANTVLEYLDCDNNQLTNLDVYSNTELTILYCFVNQLTSLNVSQNTALIDLQCNNNPLGSLDVSANIALTDLWCNSSLISSLDVSANTALNILICSNNSISELDVSQNTALTELWCSNNLISSLDMSPNTALELLVCFGNNLSELDVSQNPVLNTLSFGNNTIPSMDLSQNSALTRLFCPNSQLEFLDVANGNNSNVTDFISASNPNLTCITVDDVAYSNANWLSIDPASAFSVDCGSYVPDNNLELYLESHDANGNTVTIGAANSMGNGITNDNFVPTNKINTVSALDIQNQNIADLTGIEDFLALETLICSNNQLTSLDVSRNITLGLLDCSNNQLTSLDVTNNTGLIALNCLLNQLTSLDVSQNTALTQLVCIANQITSLDVSASVGLTLLYCQFNQLTFLNVANGNNETIEEINSSNNPNLTCINVDDLSYASTNWTTANFIFDSQSYFSTDCLFNDTPDRAYTLTVGNDFDDQAQIGDNTNATASELLDPTIPLPLGCENGGGTIDGNYNGSDIWYTLSLPDDGGIVIETRADLGMVTDTAIAVYTGTPGNLTQVACNDDINFFADPPEVFSTLSLGGGTPNDIIYIRAWTWNNNETGTFQISAYRNPAISIYVPDDNFETYLETHDASGSVVNIGDISSMGNGIIDDYVLTERINTITTLNVIELEITDLTGVEYFSALETLVCADNSLTTLNLSQNTTLSGLFCGNNNLTSLNVSQNTELLDLYCGNNNLTSLNVSQNTALTYLLCQNNELTSLNVSANIALEYFDCGNNNLTSMDVSTNTALFSIFCNGNEITNLDISTNTALTQLIIRDNDVISFDVSTNTLLNYLDCFNNNITNLTFSANNTALEYLNIGTNTITDIDLSSLTGLNRLDCYQNPLTSLDVSNLPVLDILWAEQMPFLSSLNLANGNNNNIVSLLINESPNLTCVTVDNQTTANDWNSGLNTPLDDFVIDQQTAFSTNCNEVVIEAKTYLQGAFLNPRVGEDAVMRDDLRALGLLPTSSPYDGTLLTNGGEFNIFGPNAIVDWVYLELRDDTDNSQIIEGQSALLQRDGDIVGLDGVSPLVFEQPAKHYNVVVKHRNHSNIITSLRQPFPLNKIQNYTDGSTSVLGINALVNMNGTLAMWSGDASNDGAIRFSGGTNDVNVIKDFILAHPTNPFGFLTATINGYSNQDINMDGRVKFSGSGNDSNVIKDLILSHPSNFLNVPTFTITTQVQEN